MKNDLTRIAAAVGLLAALLCSSCSQGFTCSQNTKYWKDKQVREMSGRR